MPLLKHWLNKFVSKGAIISLGFFKNFIGIPKIPELFDELRSLK